MPDGSGSGGTKGAGATVALALRPEGHTGRDTLIRAPDEAPYRQGLPRDQLRGRPLEFLTCVGSTSEVRSRPLKLG